MKFSISVFTLLLASIVAASPVPGDSSGALEKRALYSTCATWGTYSSGSFTVYQNLWGQGSATSGSQCLNVNSVSGSTFAWDTTWSWAGGPYNVKSYDNVAYNIPTGIQVSKITSIPTTWNWSQSGSSPINNVAYDLMTNASSNPSATHQYEIMIWIGAFGGAGPISSSGSAVATPTIGGRSWKLYDGYNGSMRVFCSCPSLQAASCATSIDESTAFVASSNVTSFSGDLKAFLTWLASNKGFPTSQYLVVLQAGTEPFTGSNVKLTTSKYTIALNHS